MRRVIKVLTNRFHGTAVKVSVPLDTFALTARQIRKIRRALCSIPECCCAMDDAGCRPRQVEVRPDGTGFIIPQVSEGENTP